MTRNEYRKARKLCRENGLYALHWLSLDHARIMFRVFRAPSDALAERMGVLSWDGARVHWHPARMVPMHGGKS